MAKDIKAIQCPKCGSITKQETKPGFYQCRNCQIEYFLADDDVHVYHHHERVPTMQSSAPPGNTKLPLYIFIGAVTCIVAAYFMTMLFQPTKSFDKPASTYKMPRSYRSSFVYTNTITGDPVYLRLGTDFIDKGNNKSEREYHAEFNNALNGNLIADRIVDHEDHNQVDCLLTFKTYAPDMIYAIGCNSMLLKLDTRDNKIIDVSKSLFKDYLQLSSGIARLEFDYKKDMINVMNNEGDSYHYFPTIKKLVKSEAETDSVWKQIYNIKQYYEFGYLADYFDDHKVNQLIAVKYEKPSGQLVKRDLTPGRKYFAPVILYQDAGNILIVVNTTAASEAPMSIQRIDVNTGKILWALPPDRYFLYSVTKCKHGFAIEYRKGAEADYVHGVLVISGAGKLVHNYQLSRSE
ncbi:hypothetical protein SAMN06265348_12130 [Pedobacter westerhofensis]|uniref:Uncharacterized protein n=1 Tax=Pedobacter westerhofensis TaxID=425512 RepID=A0A521FSY8_9SPHI|nr:hypothetical protein [Pedobacter westerhofensis]SMO99262.1 hypothetical protein SAMN06265348_12130 [Pedobacter westerhofensis]